MGNNPQKINSHNPADMWLKASWKVNYTKIGRYRQGVDMKKSQVVMFVRNVIFSMSLYTGVGKSRFTIVTQIMQ